MAEDDKSAEERLNAIESRLSEIERLLDKIYAIVKRLAVGLGVEHASD